MAWLDETSSPPMNTSRSYAPRNRTVCSWFLSLPLLLLPAGSFAQIVASAGPDLTVAPGVPVVLDASSTTGEPTGATFFWEQVAGPKTLKMLGQDREAAVLYDVAVPGAYRFRLTVSDGNETDTDETLLTVNALNGNTIYVDGSLASSITNGNYSVENRDNSGSDGNAYKTPQEAAEVVAPGDIVKIRGGEYHNVLTNTVYHSVLDIETDGTATAPIRFEGYENEDAVFVGLGYEDADLDGDGRADGPTYPKKRETLIEVDGDYVQLRRLRVSRSQGAGISVRGNYCSVVECVAHDNWESGFILESIGENLTASIIYSAEAFRNRHSSGCSLKIDKDVPKFVTNCAVIEGLFYRNGFEESGSKVLPISWDPAGGGNSDGIGVGKNMNDSAFENPLVDNYCTNAYLVRNFCLNNADDGIDTSFADSVIEGNVSAFNGPEGRKGYKMLRNVKGMVFRGNAAVHNDGAGLELRADPGDSLTVHHNTSFGNLRQGILGGNDVAVYLGNVCVFNEKNDFVPGLQVVRPGNWAEDGGNVESSLEGDPELVSRSIQNFELSFDAATLVRDRWKLYFAHYAAAMSPAVGSPLIDAGVVIPGYHCPRADDDPVSPMPADAPGRHWSGSAPDLGAFEFTPKLRPDRPTGLRIIQ